MAICYSYEKEPFAVGCVESTREYNGYNDSDFYATYLDVESGERKTVEYATTRFYSTGWAEVDLTKENYMKYWQNGGRENELSALKNQYKQEAEEVSKGKEVIVVGGRKVPKGTKGVVFYTKEVNYDPYGRSWNKELKIGFKDSDENVYWSYAKNVEVVNPEQYVDETELNEIIDRRYDSKIKELA